MKHLWLWIIVLCCLPMMAAAQEERAVITAANAGELTEIGRLGSGYLRDSLAWKDENRLAVVSTLGITTFNLSDNTSEETEIDYPVWTLLTSESGVTAVSTTSQPILVNAETGAEGITLSDPYMVDVFQVAMHGTRVATLSQDGTVRVWDAITGERLQVLHAQPVNGYSGIPNSMLTFSPDGTLLAAGSANQVYVWANGTETPTIFDVRGGVSAIALTDTRVIAGGQSGLLTIFDVANKDAPLFTIPAHGYPVRKIIATDESIISAGDDNRLAVWDATTGTEKLVLVGDGQVQDMVLDPSGTKLALKSFQGLKVVSTETGAVLFENRAQGQDILEVALNPTNSLIATITFMPTSLNLWHIQTGAVTGINSIFTAQGLEFSPDGSRLAALTFASEGKMLGNPGVGQWDTAGNLISFFPYPLTGGRADGLSSGMQAVSYSPDGLRLASGRGDGAIFIWDANGAIDQLPITLTGHTGEMTDLIFSPDGQRLYSLCYQDGTIRAWDVESGANLWMIESTFNQNISAMALSLDGSRIATSANTDSALRLWDAATGTPLQMIDDAFPGGAEVYGVVLTFQSDLLTALNVKTFASPPSSTILFWDAASLQPVGEYRLNSYERDMAFSADGRLIAVAGVTGVIHLLGIAP